MIPKPKAIIVDLDGTLADDSARRPLYDLPKRDWDHINDLSANDSPNRWCQEIVSCFANCGYEILFVTARNSKARSITKGWLDKNVSCQYKLWMRPEQDFRPDFIIKEDLYRLHIEPYFDVVFCVDDKSTVVEMWRKIGLVCLQCEENPA